MDYRLTGPISAYPKEYHGDSFFRGPSPELDQAWNDRLRCKKASATTIILMLTVLKMPQYASPQRNSSTTTRAVFFWVTGRDISLPQRRITTCTASGSFLHKTVYRNYYFPNDSEKKQLGRDAHTRTHPST